MSNRKRRKVSKTGKVEQPRQPQSTFREVVAKTMNVAKEWNSGIRRYRWKVRPTIRKKHLKSEIDHFKLMISQGGKVDEEIVSSIASWGVGINDSTYGKKVVMMNSRERIEEIFTYGDYAEELLQSLLENRKHKELKKILKQGMYEVPRMSKIQLINEIVSRYLGKTGDLEKREEEEDNISSIQKHELLNDEFRFISLCSIELPVDIMLEIFKYLEYNQWVLFNLGRVNKAFYITILSSFPSLRIKKKYVYKYSILVLNNIRSITFTSSRFSAETRFRLDEIKYIVSNLSAKRIRSIHFKGIGVGEYTKILRCLCSMRIDFEERLKNIRSYISN